MTAVRERILRRGIEDEMRHSFLDYSMSVIVRRALPDVRDGLKPVHRRILLAMHGLGLRPERGYKKSATVVGEVLGKYHPHGDAAVYDALVRMVQDFSLRYPLVDGQGNFGSIDGDPAAAYRYTEARLSAAAIELLAEIEKDTVAWEPNFDDRLEEPTVLPARIPNLLVNGCSGIAVGMSTNVPPHNLAEVAAALRILIADPDCDASDLMRALPGPDFPTGGYIVGREGIRSMYETGRGRMTVRARVVTEAVRGGRRQLVVTELPYAVSKSRIAAQIAGLARKGAVPEVADLRDESDREGIRLVVELKRGADASRVMDLLFRRTALQSTFGAILLALDGGRQPEEMTLKTLLERYRDHRLEVVRRRSRHDLEKAESELHVAEGLLLALADVDEVVGIVRRSADRVRAIERLRARFGLSEVQAEAILRLRLARLTELEVDALVARRAELEAEIRELRGLLADESLQLDTVVRELDDAVRRHGDERRTEILDRKDGADFGYVAASVADEDVVVAFTRQGYLKRVPMHLYRRRTNAGLALTATERYPGDYLETVAVARTQGWLLGFTEAGQVHCLRIEDVPEGARTSRGKSLWALLGLDKRDRVVALRVVEDLEDDRAVAFATRGGLVKRTRLAEFSNPRPGGVIGMRVRPGDRLLDAQTTTGDTELALATTTGRVIRFPEREAPLVGRPTQGVRGIALRGDDRVAGLVVAKRSATVLMVTRAGFALRTALEDFAVTRRGGLGAATTVTGSDDRVVQAIEALEEDRIALTTAYGVVHGVAASDVERAHRRGPLRSVVSLELGDAVAGATRLVGDAPAPGSDSGLPLGGAPR